MCFNFAIKIWAYKVITQLITNKPGKVFLSNNKIISSIKEILFKSKLLN